MRVRRGLLFWGLLLIPLGAIPLLVRAGQLDGNRLIDAWRLWPLAVIGVGLLILASRTRLAAIGITVVALTIGSIGGAALASGNVFLGAVGACGAGETSTAVDRTGTFGGPASLTLDLDCGSLDLKADQGTGWTVHAAYRGDAPTIDTAADRLNVRSPDGGSHREDWTIRVPQDALKRLDVTANAAASTVDLGTSTLDELRLTVNAGDIRVNAGSGGAASVDMTMNAGRLRLTLGSGPTTGKLSVNAGAIDLCVPNDAALSFDVQDQLTFATNLSARGLTHSGTSWTRPGANALSPIKLSIDGNAASFTLDPNGGC
jgi:hypothetical protein